MSNLNNNTTQLEALLAKVNELPEAGGGTDTSDATATANEIFAGETAYIADGKVTGTFTIEEELTEQNDLISQISTLVQQKANPQGGGNVETCIVSFRETPGSDCYYVDKDTAELKVINYLINVEITVPKNSIIVMTSWSSLTNSSGLCSQIFYYSGFSAYYVSGDCSFIGAVEPAKYEEELNNV